jgi:hypothetical protein
MIIFSKKKKKKNYPKTNEVLKKENFLIPFVKYVQLVSTLYHIKMLLKNTNKQTRSKMHYQSELLRC